MSRSLDQLHKAVTAVVKDASGKSFTKDNLVEVIDDNIGFLKNASQFFVNLGDSNNKLKDYIAQNRQNGTKMKSIAIYNQIYGNLNSAAQRAMADRFLGAFVDTLAGLTALLEECNDNIDSIFADKQITIYNTKISQVAVIGMIDNARIFSQFVIDYISLFMADRSESLFKPAPYTMTSLTSNVERVTDLINRTIGQKLSKSFVAAIKKYRSSGADTGIVNSNNQATVQYAKVNNEVTDSDILSGSKAIRIFKWIGDWFVDRSDAKIRKLRLERDLLQARVQLLQLELEGSDENDPEYKKQVEIIKNYQKAIDRINQQLAKYEED